MKAEIFQRMNLLAVHGHCRSIHAETILAQRGTILVNFMRLAQFGAAILRLYQNGAIGTGVPPLSKHGIAYNF